MLILMTAVLSHSKFGLNCAFNPLYNYFRWFIASVSVLVINVAVSILSTPTEITTGACEEKVVRENQDVEISCSVSTPGSTVVWFRIVETRSMEFIASFGFNGELKRVDASKPYFSASGQKNRLKLTSFNKARDSGAYSCGSQKGQDMVFGQVTRLVGGEFSLLICHNHNRLHVTSHISLHIFPLSKEKVEVRTEAPPKTTKPLPCTTSAPCACDSKPEKGECVTQ